MSNAPSSAKEHWYNIASLALSVVVVYLLVQDANTKDVASILATADWFWLVVAMLIKLLSLCIHEYRLWLAIHPPRPSITTTMQIGFASACINLVFPARAGDILTIAWLQRTCALPTSVATYAVGMASFFEAALFGLIMMAMLLFHWDFWSELLGHIHLQMFHTITLLTLGGIAVILLVAIVGKRWLREENTADIDAPFSIQQLIRETVVHTHQGLSNIGYLTQHIVFSAIEVWLMIASFALGFSVIGLDIAGPWMISGIILGISAISSVVLPPTYGAGHAAASVFLLGLCNIDSSIAIAYATLWWLISQIPTALVGIPCILRIQKQRK